MTFDNMTVKEGNTIGKATVLKQMQRVTTGGERIPFSIGFLTADREAWQSKQYQLKQLAKLTPGTEEHTNLKTLIENIHVGGQYIQHHECVLSGERGMHATEEKNATPLNRKPNHSKNRTRNIMFLPGNNYRRIHNSLVMMFNDELVLY